MQTVLPAGKHDPDDPLTELPALPDYYRYFYPDGRLLLLAMGEKRGDGIRVAYRDDGSLLMTRSTKADGETETWWGADGKPLEKGTAARREAIAEYDAQMDVLQERLDKAFAPENLPPDASGQ